MDCFLVFTRKKIVCILVFWPLKDHKGPFWFLWVLYPIAGIIYCNMFRGPVLLPQGIVREEVEVNSVFTLGYLFPWTQLCSAPSQGLWAVAVAAGGATFTDLRWWDGWYIRATVALAYVKLTHMSMNACSLATLFLDSISSMDQNVTPCQICAPSTQTIITSDPQITVVHLHHTGNPVIHRQFINTIKGWWCVWLGNIWPMEQRFIM